MSMEIEFTDNSAAILTELEAKRIVALEMIGLQAESHTKNNIRAAGRVDTGYYRNSITHLVKAEEGTVYVGSNLEYAIYNELGTGRYASNGQGRKGFWVYVKGPKQVPLSDSKKTVKNYTLAQAKRIMALLRAKGLDAHVTDGLKPTHALQNAVEKNIPEYRAMIATVMKK